MDSSSRELALLSLFRILGNPVNLAIVEALGNGRRTLPGLGKRLDRKKPHVCMYLSRLHRCGFVDKKMEAGKMRYWLKTPGIKAVVKKGKKFLEQVRAEEEGA